MFPVHPSVLATATLLLPNPKVRIHSSPYISPNKQEIP
jgi:hypothetical protein